MFGECEISADTKALVLLLAGTLPSKDFYAWIEQIPQLQGLSGLFKEINALRFELGNFALIILCCMLCRAVAMMCKVLSYSDLSMQVGAQATWYPPQKKT